MNKRIWIAVGILVFIGLSFLFFSGITGNVVFSFIAPMKISEDVFRISDFWELNDTEVKNGEGRSG